MSNASRRINHHMCVRGVKIPLACMYAYYTCGGNIQYNKRRELNKGYQLITSLCALPGRAAADAAPNADDAIQIQFRAVGLSSIQSIRRTLFVHSLTNISLEIYI